MERYLDTLSIQEQLVLYEIMSYKKERKTKENNRCTWCVEII